MIDTKNKSLNLAAKFCAQATILQDAVRTMVGLKEEYEKSGLAFSPDGVPMSFAGTELQHIDGDAIIGLINTTGSLKSFLDDNFHSTNLDKVRA